LLQPALALSTVSVHPMRYFFLGAGGGAERAAGGGAFRTAGRGAGIVGLPAAAA
jgi:hypothetical protein